MVAHDADLLSPEVQERSIRTSRIGYALTTALLTAVIGVTAIDGIGGVHVFGVDSDTVSAAGGGYELTVTYGAVARPALATPFDIDVHRDGGFDAPITIAVDRRYMRIWDENGLYPAPSAEYNTADEVVWEFDPPAGDDLHVTYDGRIEPALQSGRSGTVAVIEGTQAVAEVEFHTRVWP